MSQKNFLINNIKNIKKYLTNGLNSNLKLGIKVSPIFKNLIFNNYVTIVESVFF